MGGQKLAQRYIQFLQEPLGVDKIIKGVAIDPTCINIIRRLERMETNLKHLKRGVT